MPGGCSPVDRPGLNRENNSWEVSGIVVHLFVLIILLFGSMSSIRAKAADLQIGPTTQNLPLASVSAVAVDIETGSTLVATNADLVLPIASLTKIMTALVVVESGVDLGEYLRIEDWSRVRAKNAYSRIRVTSQARRGDLLRIALMSSENRAAYNLAVHHPGGYQKFLDAMNEKAAALGLKDSHFSDPTGLEVSNTATAADLAKLVVAAGEHDLLQDYSTTGQFTVNFKSPRYRLGYGNTNPLVASSRWNVELTKTGYLTEAGRCLMMTTEMDGRRIGLVLLNSKGTRSPLGDAGRIRRYLESGVRGQVARVALEYRSKVLADLNVAISAAE